MSSEGEMQGEEGEQTIVGVTREEGKIGLVDSTYAVLPTENFVLQQKYGIH